MGKSADKLQGKKIAVIGGSSGYGYCLFSPLISSIHITPIPIPPSPISYIYLATTLLDPPLLTNPKNRPGVAQILLQAGAIITIISSSQDRVIEAVEQLGHAVPASNITGHVGDVRDEDSFTKLLISLAPLDHVVFSSVDKIIRGSLADADLDEAMHLFGVKFWGSVLVGKGSYLYIFSFFYGGWGGGLRE